MATHTDYLWFQTTARQEFIRITDDVRRIVNESGITDGMALVSAMHITAAVYVNASTRFNDGGELGLGAEMGVSTSKIHAYGPMGLEHLTTQKWIVYGEGQIR